MKNISLFIALTLLFACQSEVKVDTTDVDEKFAKNCLTVKSYLDDFVKESVDYDKYYNDTCLIRGTMISSEGPMNLDQRKTTHKDLWAKYDFSNSNTISFLPGVNQYSKEVDGSVRFYFDWTVNNTENGKSITLPLYMSFDFDNDGKINFYQFFGDISAGISSID